MSKDMENKYIGIKNKFYISQFIINSMFAIFAVLTVVFWLFCWSDYNDNKLLKNGIEVEAEIVDTREIDIRPDDSHTIERAWVCIYLYVAPDGTRYSGEVGQFSQKRYAVEHLGEKVTIVIDPTDGYSTYGTLDGIAYYQKFSFTHLVLAYVFTGLLCISAYLLFYRVIYRNKLNSKILKQLDGRFVNNCIKQGEVTKVLKWIVCYVKVKYQDESGLMREKWARSWFTRKEAKFLQQKKIITIIPYKNTYGILEEMSATKHDQ
ncbi:MAG: DUF3592 domain-containing protein [Clostridia bacterium]|nr:DUF3592 domain-containing protein [Clostridia bacterium]